MLTGSVMETRKSGYPGPEDLGGVLGRLLGVGDERFSSCVASACEQLRKAV
ncbi:MAG: hypothetical protein JW909_00180 [Planctomycetes bacterium]|nr:hypothetical protein [Planctomycetota bacterium]